MSEGEARARGEPVATLQDRLDEFKKAFESGAPPYE